MASLGQSPTFPPQEEPFGQQATPATVESSTRVQTVPSWQHLFLAPIDSQLFIFAGQDARLSNIAIASAARRNTFSSVSSWCLANAGR